MAKVKVCLDTDCTRFFYRDDGSIDEYVKPECEKGKDTGKSFHDDYMDMIHANLKAGGKRRTIFTSDIPDIPKEETSKRDVPKRCKDGDCRG